jgi:hypothetical protein
VFLVFLFMEEEMGGDGESRTVEADAVDGGLKVGAEIVRETGKVKVGDGGSGCDYSTHLNSY